MARNLQDSIDKLETTIRAVGTRVMNIGTRDANRKLDSFKNLSSVEKRIEMIGAQSKIKRYYSIIKESDKLFAADAWMSANPTNRFKSAADKVRFDEIISDRRKRDRMRGIRADKAFSDKMLWITDPDLAYRKSLESEYQFASQGGDVAADEIIRTERSEKANKIRQDRRKRDRIRGIRADQSFRFAMLDNDEQFIQGAMRDKGWTRNQAEQVYFQQLTENSKWLRLIAKNNPTIAKNLIPIAKTIGKASGIPIVGEFAKNPALAAIAATIGGASFVLKNADSANEVTKNWRNYENLYGKPTTQQEWNARLAGIKDPSQIAKIYGELAAKYGGDPDAFLLSQGLALRGMKGVQKQYHADAFGLTPEMVRLAEIYAGAMPYESDLVDAKLHALENEETKGWRTGSGVRATFRSAYLSLPFMKSLEARDVRPQDYISYISGGFVKDITPQSWPGLIPMIKGWFGADVPNKIVDAAIEDDRFRAGMYDNSTTNNNGGDRSVTVIQHINADVKDKDPLGFIKEMSLLGMRGKGEAEAVIQGTDSLATR